MITETPEKERSMLASSRGETPKKGIGQENGDFDFDFEEEEEEIERNDRAKKVGVENGDSGEETGLNLRLGTLGSPESI